jgi:hypothetical protein
MSAQPKAGPRPERNREVIHLADMYGEAALKRQAEWYAMAHANAVKDFDPRGARNALARHRIYARALALRVERSAAQVRP